MRLAEMRTEQQALAEQIAAEAAELAGRDVFSLADACIEAQAETVLVGDAHAESMSHDDAESAYEAQGWARLAEARRLLSSGKATAREVSDLLCRAMNAFRLAEKHDKAERAGTERAEDHRKRAGVYQRRVGSVVEVQRLVVVEERQS
jgi:hypothetical protein